MMRQIGRQLFANRGVGARVARPASVAVTSIHPLRHSIEPSKAVLSSSTTYPTVFPSTPATAWPGLQAGANAPFDRYLSSTAAEGGGSASQLTSIRRGSPPHRLRIAVDVDEVLGRFVYALNLFYKDRYNKEWDVKDYWVYEFAKIWKCSPEESNEIVHQFFKSKHFKEGIPVIPGAADVLRRMQTNHDLVVVTSRQWAIMDDTYIWIDKHYPDLFQEIYFGNHFALEGISRRKSDICKSIGATVLIDDNPGYAVECAEAGINVMLYDWDHAYPWSKLEPGKMHPLITVVRNWDEAEAAITALQLSST